MDDFIKSVVEQLGIDESVTRNATGSVLGFLKENMGDDFSQLAEKLPGADALISSAAEAAPAEGGGGGMLGGLASAASSMLGSSAGEGLELMSLLKNLGLSTDQGGSLVTMLISFIKEKLGDTVIGQIAEKIPALKAFLG
ncbi:MAG: DUF2780 domain-containing protein [Planctomycetes bacterium]|nr:DUF2780 domain-containing protein [Planctomycetota bacterium]